jgi:hypothetical protein
MMAVLINSTLKEINSPLLNNNIANNNQQQSNPNVENLSGTIASVFAPLRSIMTVPVNNQLARILPVAQACIITINGLNSAFADLKPDMNFAAIIVGGEIVSISATTSAGPATPPTVPGAAPDASKMRVLDGIVSRVSLTNNTVGIETRTINPRGEIVAETRDYNIVPSTTITRGGAAAGFNSIVAGDMIVAGVYGDTAYSINLEQRNRQVAGTLVEKNTGSANVLPSVVIRDAGGNNHSFTVEGTAISRLGQINLTVRQLRVGDHIDLWAEYGRATQIQARPVTIPSADVYIRDIFISGRGQSYIVVTDNLQGAPDRVHLLVDGQVDPFDLAIGSLVRLWFDSQEVMGVAVLQGSTATNFTGHVQSVTNNQIIVRVANFNTRNFSIDSNTVFINSITGQIVNVNHLTTSMRVQIVSSAAQTNRAVSVTILIN